MIGPKVTARRISLYTILGFTGYGAANLLAIALGVAWQLTLAERLIACFAPPLAFLVVVTIASAIARTERIVFYQATCAGLAAVIAAGALAGARIPVLLDVATLGIGTFLVFGRLGCLAVACCHGTLGRGISYGPAHVEVGFWARWSGRALWPVQAIESAASAVLVALAFGLGGDPGEPTAIYLAGYAIVRFALEGIRGDGARPYARGLSEAQWMALATTLALASWRPGPLTLTAAGLVALAALATSATRHARELFQPPHLHALEQAMRAARAGERQTTPLGVAVSCHPLPNGAVDWVLSSTHPQWSEATCRRLAHLLWPAWQLVVGKTPGVMHVIVPAEDRDRLRAS